MKTTDPDGRPRDRERPSVRDRPVGMAVHLVVWLALCGLVLITTVVARACWHVYARLRTVRTQGE